MQHKPITIGPNLVDIWRWQLDVSRDGFSRFTAILGDSELARAACFRHERDRLRFIAGRGGLRHIISCYLGVPAKRLAFTVNAFGKPRLSARQPPLHFNLSHSGDMAVLAVSDRYHVGVDIEEILPLREDVAGRFFSAMERHALGLMPPEKYLGAFYRCWTRKEAFVKAHGAGLSFPLDAFDVSVHAAGEPQLLRLDGDREAAAQWRLLDVALPPSFVGTVAALTANNDIVLRYRDYEADLGSPDIPHAGSLTALGNQPFSRASRM
jgi:4'-phosphopantetheinyl transferase